MSTTQGDEIWDNPVATDGFEFVEYAAPDPAALASAFEAMGFAAAARHRSKDVTLYRQGDINFIINAESQCFAQAFARVHGPSICAIAFRVRDSAFAFGNAIEMGARSYRRTVGPMELNIPAIMGIGDSLLHLVDRYGERTIYDVDFMPIEGVPERPEGIGLASVDHLTHTTSTAGGWTRGRPSTSGCSASGRSATSTSRAVPRG